MMIRYLFDENMDPRFATVLARHYPMIDVTYVGSGHAPAFGTLDPEILLYLEQTQRVLITDNRKSMPGHLADHANAGRHHWGIFVISKHASYKQVADLLSLYWEASDADEWIDRVEWLDV